MTAFDCKCNTHAPDNGLKRGKRKNPPNIEYNMYGNTTNLTKHQGYDKDQDYSKQMAPFALCSNISREVSSGCSFCAGELGADELGSINHGCKGGHHLGVLARLETAVRVHPEDVGVKHSKHLVDTVSNLLCGGDPGRVDVIDTRANASSVCYTLTEDREELLIRPGVLNGDDISIHVNDGEDDVVEVRVAHVGVDLPREKDQSG
jgi:hypothetical protein